MMTLFILINNLPTYTPHCLQIGFQKPATPFMVGIIDLHHTIFFYLIIVFCVVSWLLGNTIQEYREKSYRGTGFVSTFRHSFLLEVTWTVLPSLILLSIITPSLSLLYAMEDFPQPKLTLKITGHQWYWSYEYALPSSVANADGTKNILKSYSFDSNLIITKDDQRSYPKLLGVDNAIYLPTFINIRLLVTSDDVIHSWAIPAFGIKIDAIPGRLNQVVFQIWKEGIFFGQCSELCGTGHGFMPIKVITYNNNYIFQ